MNPYTPTPEAVEAVRLALHQALAPVWMSVANALGGDQGQYDEMLRDLAAAALTATGPLIAAEARREAAEAGYRRGYRDRRLEKSFDPYQEETT